MFETPEIRTSFINAIVSWIETSYDIHGEQLEDIRSSLTSLSDEKLMEAGKEVEDFEMTSRNTVGVIDRKMIRVEHAIEEDKEKANISLPLFS
jgi:hypothetical protein